MDSETVPPVDEVLDALREHLADRYDVQRELGRGGMATVYLAEDVKHNRRKVAVKVLLPDVAASIGQERFQREIEIAASLQHPHILPLYDSGAAGAYLYYVMPFVEGESLRDKLDREKQLPQEEVIRITQQVAAGLGHAHSMGVVHRDIKPENILLSSGTAVVADFGIARAATAAAEKQSLTKTGTVIGTPYYMSPEQSTAQELDGRSDQYSLACVVYEMLIGEPPFTGPTPQAVMARHSMDMVSPPSIVREAIPSTMEAALLRALAKQPVDRFPTIVMFADALATPSVITAAEQRRTGTGQVPRMSVGTPARPRLPWRRIAMIGGPALVLVVAAVWLAPKLLRRGPAAGGPDPRHVAVLYFEDRTPDHSLAYLADGLTEALIHQLSQVGALTVISKNGVMPYRGTSVRTDSVGRALGVGTLVQGTVAASGSQLRVAVSLVDPPSGREIDSKTIEAPKENLFALQDSLAGEVAVFLRQRVGESVQLQQERARTSNAAAWESLQRALSTANGVDVLLNAGDTAASRRLLDQADSEIQVAARQDSKWARPYVERARLDYRRFDLTSGFDRGYYDTWSAAGIAQADSALARDPRNADALTLRGTLRYWRYALNLTTERGAAEKLLADAEADLQAAVAADSSQASAWAMLASLLMRRSQTAEGKLAAQHAYEADPYLTEAASVLWRLYSSTLDLQNAVEAKHWCEEGTRRFPKDPRFVECQLTLMALPGAVADIPKAWKLLEQNVDLYPSNQRDFRRRRGELFVAMALARARLADSARHVAERARPQDASVDQTRELAYIEAMFRNMVGDKSEALSQLALFLATNPAERANLAKDDTWWWNGLREDPKFKDLVGAK